MIYTLLSYPTLSDILEAFIGIDIPLPIQSYGFFVALAFISGAFFLSLEFKRKEKLGQLAPIMKTEIIGQPASIGSLLISFFVAFIIGFKLVEAVFYYSDFVDNPQKFILSPRGNWIGGIIVGLASAAYTWWDKDKKKLKKPKIVNKEVFPHQLAGNVLVIAGIAGILGAKIFHNLENFDAFLKDPMGELLSFSGLTFLGGLIVGFFAVAYYLRKNKISLWHAMDSAAVIIPLGYAIGRIGCHVAGDGCWGIPNPNPMPEWLSFLPEWMWAHDFPHNVINEGVLMEGCSGKNCHHLATPVYPTSFYEMSMMFAIFGILMAIRKRIKIPGMLFASYLILGGIERFFIEKIRVNNEYNIFGAGITQAEIISTFMMIIGIVGIILLYKNKEKIIEIARPKHAKPNNNT